MSVSSCPSRRLAAAAAWPFVSSQRTSAVSCRRAVPALAARYARRRAARTYSVPKFNTGRDISGGRGAQEKTLAKLKGEFALDVVPTKHYGANSVWRQLSILAYNVARSFQLDTGAAPRRRSRKRTYRYVLRSMRTLRFLLVVRAGRLARQALRLMANPATQALYTRISQHLAA